MWGLSMRTLKKVLAFSKLDISKLGSYQEGTTLIELMVSVSIMTFILLLMSYLFVQKYKDFNQLTNRIHQEEFKFSTARKFLDLENMTGTIQKNTNFKNCMTFGTGLNDCEHNKKYDVSIFSKDGNTKISGDSSGPLFYDSKFNPSSGGGVYKVTSYFTPYCKYAEPTCAVAESVSVNFKIEPTDPKAGLKSIEHTEKFTVELNTKPTFITSFSHQTLGKNVPLVINVSASPGTQKEKNQSLSFSKCSTNTSPSNLEINCDRFLGTTSKITLLPKALTLGSSYTVTLQLMDSGAFDNVSDTVTFTVSILKSCEKPWGGEYVKSASYFLASKKVDGSGSLSDLGLKNRYCNASGVLDGYTAYIYKPKP